MPLLLLMRLVQCLLLVAAQPTSPRRPTCSWGSSAASHEVHTPRRRRLKGVAQSTMATASWAL